jgi:hypothetical protein
MISTNGNSTEELFYNLYTKSSFIAKDYAIYNFGIDDFITKIASQEYDFQNLKQDLKNSVISGTTVIQEMSGDLELTKGLMQFKNLNLRTKYSAATAIAALSIYDLQIKLSSILSFDIASLISKSYNNVQNKEIIENQAFRGNSIRTNSQRSLSSKQLSGLRSNTSKSSSSSQDIALKIDLDGTLFTPRKTINLDDFINSIYFKMKQKGRNINNLAPQSTSLPDSEANQEAIAPTVN